MARGCAAAGEWGQGQVGLGAGAPASTQPESLKPQSASAKPEWCREATEPRLLRQGRERREREAAEENDKKGADAGAVEGGASPLLPQRTNKGKMAEQVWGQHWAAWDGPEPPTVAPSWNLQEMG